MFVYSNAHLFQTWLALNMVTLPNEEFMEEVTRYECVYNRNSKNFEDKN